MKKMGIKTKLIFSFLTAALLPLMAISYYAYWKSEDSMKAPMMEQVSSITRVTKAQLKYYFDNVKGQVIALSQNMGTKDALVSFTQGYQLYLKESNVPAADLQAARRKMQNFYSGEFSQEYSKQNDGKQVDTRSILNRLADTQLLLQANYIYDNPNPLGSKHKFERHEGTTSYNSSHGKFHQGFREYIEKFGFYDIFLIEAESGNVVYSVFKETDFATSLKTGPHSNSPLAKVFKEALLLPEGDSAVMSDYETYLPSYSAPASFMAAPIYVGGELKGVLALQIPFDEINKITLAKHTNMESLETFLVGSDYLMRSDTKADPLNHSVRSSFRHPEKGAIKNPHIDMALRGEEKMFVGKDYLGREVVGAFSQVNIMGHTWAIKTIVLKDEAFAAITQLRFALIIGTLIAGVLVCLGAFFYARSLAFELTTLAEGLRLGAGIVASSSKQIADVSARISESSTEQAASLQETVSSVDEISAMVERNADSATSSSKASEMSLTAAQRGKEKVGQMIDSIHSITKGNDEILGSIQKSNHEISEIVHVIQAISDKTKVINDIVFQTKLLSFNASVEAARAGEHGKGFAVVAEEVGNLATMSGKAATEITDMLDKSVHKVTQIVEGTRAIMDTLVRSSKEKVEFGTRTAKECAGALDEIMHNVARVNEMVREISTASQEQASGIREITKAMSELDQVTQQNTSSSNDASHTARNLQDEAQRLNEYVLKLATLVSGDVKAGDFKNTTPQGPSLGSKVIKLDKYRDRPAQESKRVVGLEFGPPSSNDTRFEDV
jgi:methyl-accepting chemotaxis protein